MPFMAFNLLPEHIRVIGRMSHVAHCECLLSFFHTAVVVFVVASVVFISNEFVDEDKPGTLLSNEIGCRAELGTCATCGKLPGSQQVSQEQLIEKAGAALRHPTTPPSLQLPLLPSN